MMTTAPEKQSADILRTLSSPPPAVDSGDVQAAVSTSYGLYGELKELGGERDRNFLLAGDHGEALIKVANAAESDELLAFQCAALRHIAKVDPDLPVQCLIQAGEGQDWVSVNGVGDVVYRVRVFDFLPGIPLSKANPGPVLLRDLGATQARLSRALRGFFHPAADHWLAWDVKRFDQLYPLIEFVLDPETRELVEHFQRRFSEQVKPVLGGLRAQVIHNDISFHNAVVDPRAPHKIAGVFDFGDLIHAPLIQDIAVSAAEVPTVLEGSLDLCASIVAGFCAETPLEDEEFRLLVEMIPARLATGVLVDAWSTATLDWRDRRPLTTEWEGKSIPMLHRLREAGPDKLEAMLRSACNGSGQPSIGASGNGFDALWQRRQKTLGNADVVSYDRPVHLLAGEGVWLTDAEGNRLLDAYNNVPHVGHCHPRVVEAVTTQTATLNTNTRYVYEPIVAYAERLTSTLPDGLDVCFFVSSGSEANDLAWRMAKSFTGLRGGVVMDQAYHGVTDAVWDLSPSERTDAMPPHIAMVPSPDDYRGPWKRGVADRGFRYAERSEEALEELGDRGFRPAAFFMDMILSSSGVFVPPPGYLARVFSIVREHGGLCVADEVQSGFGRTGKHMWGFEVDDVVPDIVTLGKPVAGGYPMGVVVTRREIAERFGRDTEFFSTTGGNPVACAAALAVLQVLHDEDLMRGADRVGDKIMREIGSLAERYELIGDVRGSGLFVGVELVTDRESLQPAAEEARAVANNMRENGVLIGTSGPLGNVLKIRPPMVFRDEHADRLLHALTSALDAVSTRI